MLGADGALSKAQVLVISPTLTWWCLHLGLYAKLKCVLSPLRSFGVACIWGFKQSWSVCYLPCAHLAVLGAYRALSKAHELISPALAWWSWLIWTGHAVNSAHTLQSPSLSIYTCDVCKEKIGEPRITWIFFPIFSYCYLCFRRRGSGFCVSV